MSTVTSRRLASEHWFVVCQEMPAPTLGPAYATREEAERRLAYAKALRPTFKWRLSVRRVWKVKRGKA